MWLLPGNTFSESKQTATRFSLAINALEVRVLLVFVALRLREMTFGGHVKSEAQNA